MNQKRAQVILLLGFTAVFIGYLSVWLPGPGAGLSFMGIEMGEWFKFFGLGPQRNIFYLPPIILGLMLAVWTMTWPENNWRAWGTRVLAIIISLLAFPAIEDITGPVRDQYTLRVYLILLVLVVALVSSIWRPSAKYIWIPWLLIGLLGIVGALLPTWLYLNVRSYAAQLMGVPVGIGLGVWLNGVGNLLVSAVSAKEISTLRRTAAVTI